ncbi:aminotransferase class V-fold PLP-dependent enzyme [Salinispira pacifica]|uniref:cysteine desulfurase n=1 Tax=Salinispira pacifica TaxID=1307761 RepID=V5WH05_9SPIO|nr:SufS family cysteine desulfurase [Salinispira pacifica]AHC15058.1 Cysteine desulfurase, SufS subfamily [Salinispira pacifica]
MDVHILEQDKRDRDFPIFTRTMRKKPFIYLDSGATSLTPEPVIERIQQYYREYGVNIHRGIYEFSERATREFHEVRLALSRFLNVGEEGQIIFTHGSTESSNLIAYSWGRKFLKKGDIILTTEYEHHSSLVPWHAVCEATGAELRFIPIDRETLELDISSYEDQLDEKVKLLVMSGMSNVTGYMPPLRKMIQSAHDNGTVVALDGAQLVSHHKVDIQELKPDFLFFSAHKMLGPTGVGVLYGRTDLLDAMDPFMYGGDMILKVHKDHSTYHPLPEKFEAGTPNIAGVLGFGAALEYLADIGMERIEAHERSLIDYAEERARDVKGLQAYLVPDSGKRGGIFSFNVEGLHSHDLGAALDAQGIAVRTGFHCAMPLMEWLGVPGTARASLYLYNTRADIDALFQGIEQAKNVFGA